MQTLAQLQQAPGAGSPMPPATLPLRVERVQTFDTPEFSGMRFLEVETKSALNRVTGMPFAWSINPYRGCSHACTYCLAGETLILMADGRTKPLAEVQTGEAVYGTVQRGRYRRYAVTRVLDHWSTTSPAHRVVLDDGTQLVASGEHRFLTARGWKHVTGGQHGRVPRPHLTLDDHLPGIGPCPVPPKHTPEYRQGYLCGVIRGGSGSADQRLSGLPDGDRARFRPAADGSEALQRTREYLNDDAIGGQGFEWPRAPAEDWAKGFLAGILDAAGSDGDGGLRISNGDKAIAEQVESCLERFGFRFATDSRPDGRRAIRLLGGAKEHLRLFAKTDPAVSRTPTFAGRALNSIPPRRVVAVEPLGLQLPLFDITTGTGDFIANGAVSHNCFARPTHAYLNLSPLGDFERTVVVKTNLVEVLRRELARPSWAGEHVAMGTNTDPYQRCEGRYRLMPGVVDALAEAYTPFSILTKGTLITRDVDRLRAAAEHVDVAAAFTVGMLDEQLWREAEPGTPPPRARLDAVRALNDAGIPTGVMVAPIMPGLNDDRDQLAELVERAAAAGATHITPIVLHLRPGVREVFWPWLEASHPELVHRYAALYRRATAARGYREPVERFVAEQRRAAWRRHGPPTRPAWRSPRKHETTVTDNAGEQLSLL